MKFRSVEEYLFSLNNDPRKAINEFILFMQVNFPALKPKLIFSMPMYLKKTKMNEGYVAISGAKNHYTIHFYDEVLFQALLKLLPKVKHGKRCVNISFNDDITKGIVFSYVLAYFS